MILFYDLYMNKSQKTEIILNKTKTWAGVFCSMIDMVFFIFNPQRWRLSLLKVLQGSNIETQKFNLIDSGLIMTNSSRTFGVEIEFVHGYEHSNEIHQYITQHFPNWAIKSDSSIRPSGSEINSPILAGATGLAEVERMYDYLKSNSKIRVNESCGLHVHVNANDLTPSQVILTSYRYANAEDQFFNRIMDKARNTENRFCMSAKLNKIQDCMHARLYDIDMALNDFNHYRYNNRFDKYRKLNIYCYGYGTIEFRHHHATVNKEEVLNWISFVTSFVDATKENSNGLLKKFISYENLEYTNSEQEEKYKALIELRKLAGEKLHGGYYYTELVHLINNARRYISLYQEDYVRFVADEPIKNFIEKMNEMGFTLKLKKERDTYNNRMLYYVFLNYKEKSVSDFLNESSDSSELAITKKFLQKVDANITEAALKIDLFENVPDKTIFYYTKLFDKQNSKAHKLKMATLNIIKERPEQI